VNNSSQRHSITLNSAAEPEDEEMDEFIRAWKAHMPSAPRSRRPAPSSDTSTEIALYLKEDVTQLPPLVWWRLNAHRFPRLAAMARDFLAIAGEFATKPCLIFTD
jgi:hypothetical protein